MWLFKREQFLCDCKSCKFHYLFHKVCFKSCFLYKLGNLVKWPSQNLPNFTHFVSTNELRKVVKFFCQKATGSWEFGPEITIFVWSRYLKYNLLEMLLPAHGYFNVPGHFLGLDYMTKQQRLAFGAARNHGSKVWKLNFQANFECLCCNTSPLIFIA